MTDRDLIELKLAMEFGAAPVGGLLPAGGGPDGPPRFLVSHYAGGIARYVRADVPTAVSEALLALDPAVAFSDADAVKRVLARHAACRQTWYVHWYVIERGMSPEEFPDAVPWENGFAILVDGVPVARAWTTQASPDAVEVEVETLPEHRRRGYARQVVAAWTAWAARDGRIAYYSHLATNDASAAIARSLGLRHLSEEIEFA